MSAFYVDIQDTGEWTRPASISPGQARDVVEHAVNDYSGVYHNLTLSDHAPEMTVVRSHMTPPPTLWAPRWPKPPEPLVVPSV